MSSAKRKAVTVETKVAVIKANDEKRLSVADVCREFGLVTSTVFTILKNKEKFKKVHEDGKGNAKKIRLYDRVDLDSALIKWFNQCPLLTFLLVVYYFLKRRRNSENY